MIHSHAPEKNPIVKLYVLKKKINEAEERTNKYDYFLKNKLMIDGSDTKYHILIDSLPLMFDYTKYWIVMGLENIVSSVSTNLSISGSASATISLKNYQKWLNLMRLGTSDLYTYGTVYPERAASMLPMKFKNKNYKSDQVLYTYPLSGENYNKMTMSLPTLDYESETLFFTNDAVIVKQFSRLCYENETWTSIDDCYKTIFTGFINVVVQSGQGQSFGLSLECEGMSKKLRADLFVQFRSLADLTAQTGVATQEYRLSGVATPLSNLTASQMVCEMLLNYFYLETGRTSFNFILRETTLAKADGYKRAGEFSNLYINKANTKKFAVVRDINTRAFDYIELNDFNNYFFNEYYKPLELIDNMKNKFMYFFYQKNDGTFVFDDFNRIISSISEKEYLYKLNLDKVYRHDIKQDDSTLLTRIRIVPEFQFNVGNLTQIETREDIIPDVEARYGIRTYETKTIRGVSSVKEIYNYARSYLIRNNDQYESMSIDMIGDPLYDINDNVLISDYMTVFMIAGIKRTINATGSNAMSLDLRFSRKPLNVKDINRIKSSATESINALTDITTKVYKFNYLDQYQDTASEEKVLYGLYWNIVPRLLYSEGRIPTG